MKLPDWAASAGVARRELSFPLCFGVQLLWACSFQRHGVGVFLIVQFTIIIWWVCSVQARPRTRNTIKHKEDAAKSEPADPHVDPHVDPPCLTSTGGDRGREVSGGRCKKFSDLRTAAGVSAENARCQQPHRRDARRGRCVYRRSACRTRPCRCKTSRKRTPASEWEGTQSG